MTDLVIALRSLVRVFPAAAILASALATAGQAPLSSNPWWPTAAGRATDVVILRDGTEQKGTLKSCVASQCQLGANSYPKDSIEWIGLVVASTRPPEVVNSDKDEAHLRDGTVHKGALVGVSSTEVVLDEGAHQRRDVVWIHLAVGPRPTPQGAEPGEEPSPVPPPPPPPSPPPKNPPPPQTRPQPPPPGGSRSAKPSYERGGLWSGQIHVHYRLSDNNGFTDSKTDVAAHLREFRYPLLRSDTGKRFGTLVHLYPEGTEIRTRFEADGQGQYAGTHCDGQGTLPLTLEPDTPGVGHGSTIWVSHVDADTTPWIGFPIVHGSPRYAVSFSVPPDKFTVNCTSWRLNAGVREESSSTEEEPYYLAVIGQIPVAGCPPFLKHVCDPEIRTIQGENGRMHGSYHNTWDEFGFHHDLEVRWSLCRDDAPCLEEPGTAPPPPEKKDCCEELARMRGRMRGLAEAAKAFEHGYNEAEAKRQQARDAIWGPTGSLFKFSNALAGLASKGMEGVWGKVLGLAAAVVSNEEDNTAFSNFGVAVEVAANPASFGPGVQAAIEHAQEIATQTYIRTHNLAEAQRVYLEELREACEPVAKTQEGLELLSIGLAAKDYWNASSELAKSLTEYGDARDEANEAKEGWDKTLDQMDETQRDITALLPCCPGAPAAPSGAIGDGSRGDVRPASLETDGDGGAATAGPSQGPGRAEVEKLQRLQAMAQRTSERTARSLVPALAPFIVGRWRQVKPELLVGLVRAAEPELRAILDEVEKERSLGQEVADALGAESPTASAPVRTSRLLPGAGAGRRDGKNARSACPT